MFFPFAFCLSLMPWPSRDIWDTRIQGLCGVVSAPGENGVEVYLSGSFAQVSLSPPRVAINPNRLYAIEPAIRKAGRFAISVMPASRRDQVIRINKVRRREPGKPEILGLQFLQDGHRIPYLDGSLQTLFCQVEEICNTGDHTLIIARVLESRGSPLNGQVPLLYPDVSGAPPRFPAVSKFVRRLLGITGTLDLVKSVFFRLRRPPPPNIAATTYQVGGQTEQEISRISTYGLLDRGRSLSPPPAPAIVRRQIGVCVVGTGWGSFHCELVRRACPQARLFVCGRDPHRTAGLARAMRAEDFFLDLPAAVADSRVQALTLALPHDLHREAFELAASAGKHALVEKPIATTLPDADAMIEAARRAGVILMVAEDMHFRPAVREAVRRIALGDIGEPLYLLAHAAGVRRPQGWAADQQRMGGGVLMDIGVHYVRGLRLLMGEPHSVLASRAMQINTKMSAEDSVQLLFSSPAGWEAHLLLSWSSNRGHLPDIVVSGEKGTLHLWPGAGFLDYYPVAPLPLTRLLSFVRPQWLQARLSHPAQQRIRVALAGRDKTGYESEVREFLAAVAGERQPATGPQDARRDLQIVLRSYEALSSGQRLSIQPS